MLILYKVILSFLMYIKIKIKKLLLYIISIYIE